MENRQTGPDVNSVALQLKLLNFLARLKTGEAADRSCIVFDQPQPVTTVGVVGGSLPSGFAHCCGSQNRGPSEHSVAFNHA